MRILQIYSQPPTFFVLAIIVVYKWHTEIDSLVGVVCLLFDGIRNCFENLKIDKIKINIQINSTEVSSESKKKYNGCLQQQLLLQLTIKLRKRKIYDVVGVDKKNQLLISGTAPASSYVVYCWTLGSRYFCCSLSYREITTILLMTFLPRCGEWVNTGPQWPLLEPATSAIQQKIQYRK